MRKWMMILSLIFLLTVSSRAQSGDLTVDLYPYPDVPIRLYLVAQQEEDGAFVTEAPFEGCPVDWKDTSAQGCAEAARLLSLRAQEKNVTPAACHLTDEAGQVWFEDLPGGVYLVQADPFRRGTQVITPNPFLVFLSERDLQETNHWFLAARMKYTAREDTPQQPDTGGTFPWMAALLLATPFLLTFGKRMREKT